MVSEKLVGLENSYSTESERMRTELNRLRGAEDDAKNKTHQVLSLQEELERLKKELSVTRQEKKTIEDWAQTYRDEMEKVRKDPLEASAHSSVVFLTLRLSVSSKQTYVVPNFFLRSYFVSLA